MRNRIKVLREEIKIREQELEQLIEKINIEDRAMADDDDDDDCDTGDRQRWLAQFTARQAAYHRR